MKSYTDLEQSKKLSEILPIESADGYWDFQIDGYKLIADELGYYKNDSEIPCWSLAALVDVLPDTMLGKDKDGYVVMSETMGSGLTAFASNPVDVCYEMIIELHEQKLL